VDPHPNARPPQTRTTAPGALIRNLAGLCLLALLAAPAGAGEPAASPDRLGTVDFPVTGDAEIRVRVVRGVKLLHHMMYSEADREFAAVVAHDPDCGFGYWGRAMAIVHPLWADIPDADDLARGEALVRAGLARSLHTERERAYLTTMEAFFRPGADRTLPARLGSTDAAWAGVAGRYPDDLDAVAFGALYHLAPARFLPRDKSRRLQFEAAAALDRVAARIPDHPGALHYKIHAFDFPLLAGRALEVCDAYGELAPDVPHALHMPTHIYTRLGRWEKSIEFNERSAAAARVLARDGGSLNSHLPHALDYLAYAYLQRGQYRKVEAIAREVAGRDGPYQPVNRPAMAFAFAAIPARLALERRNWAAAARLELRRPAAFPWGDKYLYGDSITRFARAYGAVRAGDRDAARRELADLESLRGRIVGVIPGSYWATQADVQVLAVTGWCALAEGRGDEAVAALRRAVALESSTDKEAVTPGEVLPAGEMLGEILCEQGQFREALAAFEEQLTLSPNRLNGLAGAARAAEQAGDSTTAARYFRELLAVAAEADPGDDRVEHARTFLARQSGNTVATAP